MSRSELLIVRAGSAAWLDAAQALLAALGLMAILISPADWRWKLSATVLLLVVSTLLYSRSGNTKNRGELRLFADGSSFLATDSGDQINALQRDYGWVSRWVSVVSLQEFVSGRVRYLLVCRSENYPDDYRRLLVLLRMRGGQQDQQGMTWS